MTITVDKDKALELLDKAVAAKGEDYRVGGCVYFNTETKEPVCIVGHVLAELGVGVDDFEAAYTVNHQTYDFNGQSFSGLYKNDFIKEKAEFTPEAVEILDSAQTIQDIGRLEYVDKNGDDPRDYTWGNAVRVAREKAND